MVNYEKKYLKYKTKYLKQQKKHNSQKGGSSIYEEYKYKIYDFFGISSNVTNIRTDALEFYETQLKETKIKIIETINELEDKAELLEYNKKLMKDLLKDSPEIYKIQHDDLDILEQKYKKDLDNTLNTENIENIKKEYNEKKNELTQKLDYELLIRKKFYESNLQLSENAIQHLKEEIELKERRLIHFNESVIRYENNIQQIIEHIEGPQNESIVDELAERLIRIPDEEGMVSVDISGNNSNENPINATDVPEQGIKLN